MVAKPEEKLSRQIDWETIGKVLVESLTTVEH